MPEPIITPAYIATLAFLEFVKSGSGELAKKFTAEAITIMGKLRKLISNRLTGKHPAAEELLAKAKAGDEEVIEIIAKLLDAEMDLDEAFAEQAKSIAQEITQLIDDHSNMKLTSFGDKSLNVQGTFIPGTIIQNNNNY
jgi:precorrin-2 methylase